MRKLNAVLAGSVTDLGHPEQFHGAPVSSVMFDRPDYIMCLSHRSSGASDPPSPRSRADIIELNALTAQVTHYRREAQRLLGLAASSTVGDAKRQFVALAQQYETLAGHTAQRLARRRA